EDVNCVDSKIKLSGAGMFGIQAETSGRNREEILRQLKGSSTFKIKDGIVQGIDLNFFLQLADATIHKQPIDQLVNARQTEFNELSGTAMLKNGMAETTDMLLVAPTFTTAVSGNLELISRHLDLQLKIKPQLQNTQLKWDIPVL